MRTYQSRTLLGILNDISLPCASVYFQIAPKDRYNHVKALHFHRPIFPQLSHFPFSILAVITSSRNIYSLQGALPPLFTRRPLYFDLLFPMLNYCILIGCSLHTKSDIMQDDVNCPITLSWKR